MSRYERKQFFERLVALRDAYRAETHEPLDLTMTDAMALAERALTEAVAGSVTRANPATRQDGAR